MQKEDKVSVLTSRAHHSVGQFTAPAFEGCDSSIMQAGVLILPLYSLLQKRVLQTKALQKDATNKATSASSGMIRQGNNPKPQAHIIPPMQQRKSTPWNQHQDSDSNSGNGTTCTPVWERDPSTYHLRTRRLPDRRSHYSQRQPEREEARRLRT